MSSLLNQLRYLACYDRLAWLNHISADFAEKPPLHIQHQALFTILAEKDPALLARALYDCMHYPNMRVAYVEEARAYTQEEMRKASMRMDKDTVSLVKSADPRLKFDALVAQDAHGASFRNELGFAYFPSSMISMDDTLSVNMANGTLYSSYCGVMYYGFHSGEATNTYLQSDPIHVLAETFKTYIETPNAKSSCDYFPYTMAIDELIDYANTTKDWKQRLESDLREFLLGHEKGHQKDFVGNKELHALMEECGLTPSAFFDITAPLDEFGDGWQRIASGQGSAKDVMMALSDYLSNMAILRTGISEPSLKLLRVFNWLRARPPMDNFRPKGLLAFLAQSVDYDLTRHEEDMRDIFTVINESPERALGALRSQEMRAWQLLRAHRPSLPALPLEHQ